MRVAISQILAMAITALTSSISELGVNMAAMRLPLKHRRQCRMKKPGRLIKLAAGNRGLPAR